MTDIIDRVVRAAGFDDVSRAAEERAIRGRISPLRAFADVDDLQGLRRMALVLELRALDTEGAAAEELYEQAFTFWRLLLERQAELGEADLYEAGLRLAMSGTLAKRVTEVRQVLGTSVPSAERLSEALASPAAVRDVNWRDQVLRDVRLSLILLTRKNGGWADIALALALLRGLRDRQQALESEFLDQVEQQRHAALDLVGLYHLAQMVTVVGRFLETGDGVTERITVQLDRHASRAAQAFEAAGDMDTETETRLVHRSLTALVSNSIWSQLYGLGQSFSDFAQQVARHASSPLLELWPSQQEALQSNFFDTYRRALLVQMPTSAGKSLLAKLAILQTNALYPTATIAYVVPTRVLVNQVTDDLRVDLDPLGITVEQAVPVFEMDPSENQLLTAETRVIVTTAEKLDLLIRTNHPAMQELSMVIVDEAHNLNDGERGARLELVLATIQRDRPGSRYLLLSPFLPNGRDLVRWLGGTRQLDPITVSWRPNKRVVGALEIRSEGRGRNFIDLVTANAVEQSNLPAGERIELLAVGNKPSGIGAVTRSAVDALSHRGGTTLVVVYGRMKAAQRAQELAATKPAVPGSSLREATRRFLEAELGAGNSRPGAPRRLPSRRHVPRSPPPRGTAHPRRRSGRCLRHHHPRPRRELPHQQRHRRGTHERTRRQEVQPCAVLEHGRARWPRTPHGLGCGGVSGPHGRATQGLGGLLRAGCGENRQPACGTCHRSRRDRSELQLRQSPGPPNPVVLLAVSRPRHARQRGCISIRRHRGPPALKPALPGRAGSGRGRLDASSNSAGGTSTVCRAGKAWSPWPTAPDSRRPPSATSSAP
jgi:hypothetical protein